jgi:hypothetical protein
MSVVLLGSTSGSVTLQEPAVAGSTVIDLPATSGTMAVLPTATGVLTQAAGGTGTTTGYYGFKNRLINGGMVIDQRNAGASVPVTASAPFTVDRWQSYGSQSGKLNVQQTPSATETGYATRVGAGFTSYLACTSQSAYTVGTSEYFNILQSIEGLNISDLAWGTANAKTITISFWAYSSLTGTFGGAINNSGVSRSYPFSYTISAANTWEQKTITIAGDTSGTWLTTNGVGMYVRFGLGAGATVSGTAGAWSGTAYVSATGATSVVGTNGATFYITGVQLEKGSTATSFDVRPYTTELALCQRYYIKINNPAANAGYGPLIGAYTSIRSLGAPYCLPVPMRVNGASFVIAFSNVSLYRIDLSVSYPVTSIGAWAGDFSVPSIDIGVASGLTAGTSYIFTILTNGFISYSAEL